MNDRNITMAAAYIGQGVPYQHAYVTAACYVTGLVVLIYNKTLLLQLLDFLQEVPMRCVSKTNPHASQADTPQTDQTFLMCSCRPAAAFSALRFLYHTLKLAAFS